MYEDGFQDKRCNLKLTVLHLAGKEVGDKDRTGRDSLGTFLALVVVVVLPATTSVLCKYIVDSDRLRWCLTCREVYRESEVRLT